MWNAAHLIPRCKTPRSTIRARNVVHSDTLLQQQCFTLSFVVDSPLGALRIFRVRTCFLELILTNVTARQFQAKDAGRLTIGEEDFTRYHETTSHRRLQRADLVVWIACVDTLYECLMWRVVRWMTDTIAPDLNMFASQSLHMLSA